MFWEAMKPVVILVEGKPNGFYECIGDAAKAIGVRTSTITNRVASGREVNGVSYRYPNEGEIDTLPNLSPPRIRKKVEPQPPKPKREPKKIADCKSDDTKLDRDSYTIVSYEVRNIRECITPCPFLDIPKPKVGSLACVNCGSFKGREKRTHEVACSRRY